MSNDEATIHLEGRLTASEVAQLDARYRARFASRSLPAAVNLAGVESADSSALALLLEWQAQANARGHRIQFEQPPEALRVIARLTGIAPLLGWAGNETE